VAKVFGASRIHEIARLKYSAGMAPIVIVGAGPAGMMLAYQLASNDVPVRVLERHKDFDREFRGEFAQPSLLAALDPIGILEPLRRDGRVMPIRAVRMHFRTRAFASNVGPDGGPAGEAIHQPSFLLALHRECERFAHYRLDLGATVTGVVDEGGRVSGVRARVGGTEEAIDARYVVVCNGRSSALRKSITLPVDELEKPYSLLWLRFDLTKRPELVPDTLDGFVMPRGFYVLYPTYGQRVQLMWRRPRKYPLDWKAPITALRAELLADAPKHWLPIFEESMSDDTERQVLRVVCDRLRRWHAPGVLFLGDAAHTMSPIGGQGLTIAVRDSIVAANHIIDDHRANAALDDSLLAAIEAERRPEFEKMQAFQVRAGRITDAPPAAQWLMSRAIVPLVTKLQGASYLGEVQHGVTNVKMKFAVPISGKVAAPRERPADGS
jgi:2-polyprenyl-6-methoxyphenol hydroxylase-like FAD-dependent oxidoreductase